MTARPMKDAIVGVKSLADLMLESNTLLRPETVGSYKQYLVAPEDFEMLVSGACGGDYPHGLMLIMQERLKLETDVENFLAE